MMPAPPSARSLSCSVVSRTSPETTAVRWGSLELAISRSSEILTLALSVVSTRYKARQKCHVSSDHVTIAPAPWPTDGRSDHRRRRRRRRAGSGHLSSGAGPVRRPLLGERDRAFSGVIRTEHRHQDLVLLAKHGVRAPAAGFDDDPLGGGHRQRTIDGDPLGGLDRGAQG